MMLFALPAVAATIHVPGDYKKIQDGVGAAKDGDTVLVAPGTYYENIDFLGKAITVTSILSTDPATISAATAATIIDGNSTGPVVTFQTSEPRTAILEYFTIQNGGVSGQVYGGVYVSNSSPTILGNTITNNNCVGIYSNYAAPLIQNNEISSTLASRAECGNIYGLGAAILSYFDLATSGAVGYSAAPAIIGNTIENNIQSGNDGSLGGASTITVVGTGIIEKNIIRNNFSFGGGGALSIGVGSPAVLVLQNLIYDNVAGGGGAIAVGGGLAPGYSALIANNTIMGNSSGVGGSGSQILSSFGGPSAAFVNNVIVGAEAQRR